MSTFSIPKSKKVLEFLSELDGQENRLKDTWIFIRNDVVVRLFHEFDEVFHNGNTSTYMLFHEVEDKFITSIALRHESTGNPKNIPLWSFVSSIRCTEDSPVFLSFTKPTLLPPRDVIFLIMKD